MADSDSGISFEADAKLVQSLNGLPQTDVFTSLQQASRAGKKPGAVLRDILRLKGRLHPKEYFYYGLYGDGLSGEDKRRFVGKVLQTKLHVACNDLQWKAVADDKSLFYAAMKGFGFSVPETVAVFRPGRPNGPGTTLSSKEKLAEFLKDPGLYPLFAKPVDGIYSIGAFGLSSFDAGDGRLVFTDGRRVAPAQVAEYMQGLTKAGYLFQKPLSAHPQLRTAFGTTTLPTVRFLVVLSETGAEIISTVCKIPAKGSMADNFWRGNMLGAVSLDEGVVSRVVSGTGFETREHEQHPDSRQPIQGMVLPDWEKARQLCLSAAATLPGIRTQSWDIALTETGPAIIETNWGGDLNLHQLAHRRGILQDRYLAHLHRCGCKIGL